MSWVGRNWLTGGHSHPALNPVLSPLQTHGCYAAGAEDGCGGALWPGRESEWALACSEGAGTTL